MAKWIRPLKMDEILATIEMDSNSCASLFSEVENSPISDFGFCSYADALRLNQSSKSAIQIKPDFNIILKDYPIPKPDRVR